MLNNPKNGKKKKWKKKDKENVGGNINSRELTKT